MEQKEEFDKRYHASYAAKLKTVALEKVESAIEHTDTSLSTFLRLTRQ